GRTAALRQYHPQEGRDPSRLICNTPFHIRPPARRPRIEEYAMKLLRVGAKGLEKPAILHSDGTYRDLSSVVPDLRGMALTPEGIGRIRATDPNTLPVLDAGQRIGPCVGSVGKFICVGLNYAD